MTFEEKIKPFDEMVESVLRQFVFEFNDPILRGQVADKVATAALAYQNKEINGDLELLQFMPAPMVICDENNNPKELCDAGYLVVDVFLLGGMIKRHYEIKPGLVVESENSES